MSAGGLNKLPFGNMPRLLLAWVCTEVVRTQGRVLILGSSLSDFMRKLEIHPQSGGRNGVRTRLVKGGGKLDRWGGAKLDRSWAEGQFLSAFSWGGWNGAWGRP